MQFVSNGPDIPNELLLAHEEGDVVFFCGAGISYPADLPGFQKLVLSIYKKLNEKCTPEEKSAYKGKKYDTVLDLLERRIPEMRHALLKALKPDLEKEGAVDTHAALLQLASHHEDKAVRLVTTNFDRIFEYIAETTQQEHKYFTAPMLPIPKKRWDGLVYLHGLLPEEPSDLDLKKLVITSGDFGLAYLVERWAARFVSELFRNYVICFVGYSIDDPIMRYMMDAYAAESRDGEKTARAAYALVSFSSNKREKTLSEWQAKGVVPILYEVPQDSNDHSALHKTLKVWAETYRDGSLGRERIVTDLAGIQPAKSTQQDDFVGRMLWALSYENGLPAKFFADLNPVPLLEWVYAFSKERYRKSDLGNFGVAADANEDNKLKFSFVRRPTPYRKAPQMSLVSDGWSNVQLDEVMLQLGRWLTRHLANPDLIFWVVESGGVLHDKWKWQIDRRLKEIDGAERKNREARASNFPEKFPDDDIPGQKMRKLWHLLLAGRVKSRDLLLFPDSRGWIRNLEQYQLSSTVRLELRQLLTPMVVLRRPFLWGEDEQDDAVSQAEERAVDWELVLATNDAQVMRIHFQGDAWEKALPSLIGDLQQLLCDALDLMRDLGGADDHDDRSSWCLPSISDHEQNSGIYDWVLLIELLRDAWLAVLNKDPNRAEYIAQEWFDIQYPVFKRLALFAASHDDCISPGKWVKWLLSDKAFCLWSSETRRETMRLIVLQGKSLKPSMQKRLEGAILKGPFRDRYDDELEPDQWLRRKERSIWYCLAKLGASGVSLGGVAQVQLDDLSKKYPEWQLAGNESDEFSFWISSSDGADYQEFRNIECLPNRRKELVGRLKQIFEENNLPNKDDWQEVCHNNFPLSLCALCELAQEDIWPIQRWSTALQVWSSNENLIRSWRYAAPLINKMPDDDFRSVVHSISHWLKRTSQSSEYHREIFIAVCERALEFSCDIESRVSRVRDGVEIENLVMDAINHPVGDVAQALLNRLFISEPADNEGMAEDISLLLNDLCREKKAAFRHGRVIMAANLIALFRIDKKWTEKKLLPLLDWEAKPDEAKAAWQGFLWSPRLYPSLFSAFKKPFLDTAKYYDRLGEYGGQYAALLTYVGLDSVEGYDAKNLKRALSVLPADGLQRVAKALYQALAAAGDQKEEYLRNRVKPFWEKIWPRGADRQDEMVASNLVRLCIVVKEKFPEVLEMVRDWLCPVQSPNHLLRELKEKDICTSFPEKALELLSIIIKKQQRLSSDFGDCLKAITRASPDLEKDQRYIRLHEHSRSSGGA